ncbi:hypothetical protein RHSIM_Rhsim01G0010500 [Rhododendron simsii]|uniref:Expansin-like EG45 domain-containing protein n=1 Tax=Rhododendron simsii TaxID=118357 RepID=A0A834HM14_RHOSS|nr:hypothetical protein RHSIM_Rhsim01G0010500 [Rhododendron simsii]
MGTGMLVLVIVGITKCLSLVAYADQGYGTYYTPPYVPSACYGYQDEGVMIGAASDTLWNGGAACGRMYSITCIGGTNQGVVHPCTGQSVTIKIVDHCPSPGCQATIDLSQESFAIIADVAAGKIVIEYNQ